MSIYLMLLSSEKTVPNLVTLSLERVNLCIAPYRNKGYIVVVLINNKPGGKAKPLITACLFSYIPKYLTL